MRLLPLLCLTLAGCPEEHEHDPDGMDHSGEAMAYADGMTMLTEDGHFEVALTLSEGGTVGTHDVTLEVFHERALADVAGISLEAYMPAHGHGTNEVTVVAGEGPGTYTAEALSLFMAGDWELTVSIEDPEHAGDAVFLVTIEED